MSRTRTADPPMTEERLIEALREALVAKERVSDPGYTIEEWTAKVHGTTNGQRRVQMGRLLMEKVAAGEMVKGVRHMMRADGRSQPIAVFRPK